MTELNVLISFIAIFVFIVSLIAVIHVAIVFAPFPFNRIFIATRFITLSSIAISRSRARVIRPGIFRDAVA